MQDKNLLYFKEEQKTLIRRTGKCSEKRRSEMSPKTADIEIKSRFTKLLMKGGFGSQIC